MTASKLTRTHRYGFALVSAVSVLALLLLIGLAILSLSTSTTRESKVDRHTEIARANARMALAIAIAQLQEALGPDQRVSATADILENDERAPLSGREKWLGVWKTTHTAEADREFPMVGKASAGGGGPYESDAYYEDLRNTNAELQEGQWRDRLHMSWLASGGVDAQTAFTGDTLEILSARGQESAVEVGLIPVESGEGDNGSYAWWVADNSMKASLGTAYDSDKGVGLALAPYAEPATIDPLTPTSEGSEFADLTEDLEVRAKYASYSTIRLAHEGDSLRQALKDSFHDLTVSSFGMPIDTALGGFKKDLTPLLQGDPNRPFVSFTSPSEESVFPSRFDSNAPIIPGRRHATMGPKFSSMRHWTKFSMENPEEFEAEVESPTGASDAIIQRNSEGWAWSSEEKIGRKWWLADHQHGRRNAPVLPQFEAADGTYFDEERWAEDAPKFYPVMTDVRWHYYVNAGFDNPVDASVNIAPDDEGFMAHIIPRVSLWNPYSRPLTFDRLVVMMPNPMSQGEGNIALQHGKPWQVNQEARREFIRLDDKRIAGTLTEEEEVEYQAVGALQFFDGSVRIPKHADQRRQPNNALPQMDPDRGDTGADLEDNGLFPTDRYLAFVLESTTIQPGENLVFSPKVEDSDYPNAVDALQDYTKDSVDRHILSAESTPSQDRFVHLCRRDFVGFDMATGNRLAQVQAERLNNAREHLDWVLIEPDNTLKFQSTHTPNEAPPASRPNSNVAATDTYKLPIAMYKEYILERAWRSRNNDFADGDYDGVFSNTRTNVRFSENMPYMLKAAPSSGSDWSIDDILDSDDFPTLQLMHHGNGGAVGTTFRHVQADVGAPRAVSGDQFRPGIYTEAIPPLPSTHAFGTKLLWFNEVNNEAAPNAPFRLSYWAGDQNLVFNQAPIANWNMRASMITRSPATPTIAPDFSTNNGREVYGTTNGAWALQTNPNVRGGAGGDIVASSLDNLHKKNPFGSVNDDLPDKVILFDFADSQYGVLSLGELRHAPLSQFSFHPSYIIGGSLSDLHSSRERSAIDLFDNVDTSSALITLMGGGTEPQGPTAGRVKDGETMIPAEYDSLFRAGENAPNGDVLGESVLGDEEIPFYDIAYEVNHNLWDSFFVSTMKLDPAQRGFDLSTNDSYWNQRHQLNPSVNVDSESAKEELEGSDGLRWGFWHNGPMTMIDGQFNVNSTSVNAWKAFLSANRRLTGVLQDGASSSEGVSKFSRVKNPLDYSGESDLTDDDAWSSGRGLEDGDITLLANAIVEEVKNRGPFLSLGDFVNRRLADGNDESSRMGTLDSAIHATPINSTINTTYGINPRAGNQTDNNPDDLKGFYLQDEEESTVASTRGYGLPGYLTQGDILESHGFAMSARGETFTIRAYGESRGAGNEVEARAWLEAVVVRTPEYVNAAELSSYGQSPSGANSALDVSQMIDYRTGELIDGDLSEENTKYGRKFKVISSKWISSTDDFEL